MFEVSQHLIAENEILALVCGGKTNDLIWFNVQSGYNYPHGLYLYVRILCSKLTCGI